MSIAATSIRPSIHGHHNGATGNGTATTATSTRPAEATNGGHGSAVIRNGMPPQLRTRIEALEQTLRSALDTEQERTAFDRALDAVQGDLFRTLGDLRGAELQAFFAEHPDFSRHVYLLRDIHNIGRVAVQDMAAPQPQLQRDEPVPVGAPPLVPVATSHPTHARGVESRRAYQLIHAYLSAPDGAVPAPSAADILALLPPGDWTKPDLRRDEMPMMAGVVAHQVEALVTLLNDPQVSAPQREQLLQTARRLAVWGAYDQDGHPSARPTDMLLQRAHLRSATWALFVRLAQDSGLSNADLQPLRATRQYWSDVVDWFTTHGDALARDAASGKASADFDYSAQPGYPSATGKLGEDESSANETNALLKVLAPHRALRALHDVVQCTGTSGARGQFRYTASGARGVWKKQDDGTSKVDAKTLAALNLRLAEIRALQGDVNTVIIAECEAADQVCGTVDLLRKAKVPVWLDPDAGSAPDARVAVMPLVESGGMAGEVMRGLRTLVSQAKEASGTIPAEIHVMVAGSDLVNREGPIGQLLETYVLQAEALKLCDEFPGLRVHFMEGVGGSNVRTGGARDIVALRDATRFMHPDLSSHVSITVQGIKADTELGSPRSARATLAQAGQRMTAAFSERDLLEENIAFLRRLGEYVGRPGGAPMRSAEGYLALYAAGNPVLDGLSAHRFEGSRSPVLARSKGFGADGERTITYVKAKRVTGGLSSHNDWRGVPKDLLDAVDAAWATLKHRQHALVRMLLASTAVELTRMDQTLAREVFGHLGGLDGEGNRAKREALDSLCEAHDHLADLLAGLGVIEPRNPGTDGQIVPRDPVVVRAVNEELGIAHDSERAQQLNALLARRGEVRLQAHLTAAELHPQVRLLQMAYQRINPHDGPGATDLTPPALAALGLPLHHGPAHPGLASQGRSHVDASGVVHLTQEGERVLGARLADHENFHLEDNRAWRLFIESFGAPYAALPEPARSERDALAVHSTNTLRQAVATTLAAQPDTDTGADADLLSMRAALETDLATHQKTLAEARLAALDALPPPTDGTATLALQAERCRQQEKRALATATTAVIAYLSAAPALAAARVALAPGQALSNEGQFLLHAVSGGLLGVPSHLASGRKTEETRAWLQALTADDLQTLCQHLPDCADALRQLQQASAASAGTRASLLAHAATAGQGRTPA